MVRCAGAGERPGWSPAVLAAPAVRTLLLGNGLWGFTLQTAGGVMGGGGRKARTVSSRETRSSPSSPVTSRYKHHEPKAQKEEMRCALGSDPGTARPCREGPG